HELGLPGRGGHGLDGLSQVSQHVRARLGHDQLAHPLVVVLEVQAAAGAELERPACGLADQRPPRIPLPRVFGQGDDARIDDREHSFVEAEGVTHDVLHELLRARAIIFTMAHVLVVDDEPAVRRALERALQLDNYDVSLAADGEEALDAISERPVDAVILDVAMPRLDGLEVCRRMRQAGDRTPILMLTARDAIDDRVRGLDVGADDYLVKPFALRELQARIRALLRRSGEGPGEGEVLRYADLELDPVAHEVRRGDRVIELSKTEFLLLELFLRHPRQVLTRSTIFENVWGYDFGPTSNALGVYMGYLRRKTEAGDEPRLLHTVRGVGYVLRD